MWVLLFVFFVGSDRMAMQYDVGRDWVECMNLGRDMEKEALAKGAPIGSFGWTCVQKEDI